MSFLILYIYIYIYIMLGKLILKSAATTPAQIRNLIPTLN